MAYTRRNVWGHASNWAEPVLWYARGVRAMKARALNEPTAWGFYAAIHGIDASLWEQLGYLKASDPKPTATVVATYWNQCQHGSWYFLPWHRGYLLAFEAVVREAVQKLNGPADWALPYWNYFKPNESRLPPAFASPDWPDGRGDNPLYVKQRYGPRNNGQVNLPVQLINMSALGEPHFSGAANGGPTGFGGIDTGFSHGGRHHGELESQPHDVVHGLVGGANPETQLPGLMSDPDTAALDPIFWLHHANIDRLWEVWKKIPTSLGAPRETNWLKGPAAIGEHPFTLPMPGKTPWVYTPGQMSDLKELGYDYDDTSVPQDVPHLADRLRNLGATASVVEQLVRKTPMTGQKKVELLGANQGPLRLEGAGAVSTAVSLDSSVRQKVAQTLAAAKTAQAVVPDRVFLNLENVRGLNDATAFSVYLGVPVGEDPSKHPDHLAGTIALFGVRKATLANGPHAGDGLNFVLNITAVIDRLHLQGALNASQLHVQLVPVQEVPVSAQVSIGRVSLYREGQ